MNMNETEKKQINENACIDLIGNALCFRQHMLTYQLTKGRRNRKYIDGCNLRIWPNKTTKSIYFKSLNFINGNVGNNVLVLFIK